MHHVWLVVATPLENMNFTWDFEIPNGTKCSKPPTCFVNTSTITLVNSLVIVCFYTYICIYIYILVDGFNPSEKIVSWDQYSEYMENMFQTTKLYAVYIISIYSHPEVDRIWLENHHLSKDC